MRMLLKRRFRLRSLLFAAPLLFEQSLSAQPANLLSNPGFEQVDASGEQLAWSDNGFVVDSTVSRTGLRSLLIRSANTIQYTQKAWQNLSLKAGAYSFGAWVKTEKLAGKGKGGLRVCLNAPAGVWPPALSACTGVLKGTNDWTFLGKQAVSVPQDTTAQILLDAFNDPSGAAWIDDAELTAEPAPPTPGGGGPPADFAPPVITSVSSSAITSSSAVIAWFTSEPADTQVEYGVTTSYGSLSAPDSAMATSHTVTLAGLAAGTTYHYRVRSADASANLALSGDYTFQTEAPAPITPPPVPPPAPDPPPPAAANLGGLTSLPVGAAGPNLLANAGFDQVDANGKPLSWGDNGFTLDYWISHSGRPSFKVVDANTLPYAQSAWQKLEVKAGVYGFGGWVKTSNLAATTGSGVRICVRSGYGTRCTPIVKGSNSWQLLSIPRLVISADTTVRFALETYGDPDGTAWFDDLDLHREQIPLDVFMRYPNYRGILFSDQSQVARFHVGVTPPDGKTYGEYQISGRVVDESSGVMVLGDTFAAAPETTAAFDFSSLPSDRTYLVTFDLTGSSGSTEFRYPSYRVVKQAGSARASMTVSFDENNRFVLAGVPSFLLGVYDSALPYTTVESTWESVFTNERRLFELPINLYLNYWFGAAGNPSMLAMMNVLGRHGIRNLTNANCFSTTPLDPTQNWFGSAADADVIERSSHPAFAGFYAADECRVELVPDVFNLYARMKALDPGGVTLATLFADSDLVLWRDSADVLATDPYPLYGAEPVGGYPLSTVSAWTKKTRDAVMGSRPFATTLQFFQSTSNSRWPSEAELRNMTYMAIAEGANGLFYWSIGTRALRDVCTGWCDQKVTYFTYLKNVMTEVKSLEPALVSVDRPDLLAANSAAGAIHTRVKYAGAKTYIIAVNTTNTSVAATFTLAAPVSSVTVYNEQRAAAASEASFSDNFGAYQAHVYIVE